MSKRIGELEVQWMKPPKKVPMRRRSLSVRELNRDAIRHYACIKRVRERFWNKVLNRKGHPGGCWLWCGGKDAAGYGRFQIAAGVSVRAHRFAYLITQKKLPARKLIRHLCDNPLCVNPLHLIEGTVLDNSRDMAERGRSAKGLRKLSDEQVRTVRSDWATRPQLPSERTVICRKYAELYKVSRSTVHGLLTGRTYREIPTGTLTLLISLSQSAA
jgi:hypothetical protein